MFSGRTGTEFDRKDGIILTDSLGKNFRHLSRAVAVAVPGATISSLSTKLQTLKLSSYKVILILVGTNDLTPKSVWVWYKMKLRKGQSTVKNLPRHPKTPPEAIKSEYRNLLEGIRQENPNIFILVSAILPRPFDFPENKNYLYEVNRELESLCLEFNACYFLKSFKPIPRPTHFAEDGLHLSQQGSLALQNFFMSHLVYRIKHT